MSIPPISSGQSASPMPFESDEQQRAQKLCNTIQSFEEQIRNPTPDIDKFAASIQQLNNLTKGQ